MDSVRMKGTIVIGEGERDKAPMLYIGENVGTGGPDAPGDRYRRRSPGGYKSLRYRRTERHCGHGGRGKGRTSPCSGYLHGQDRCRPNVKGSVDLDAPVEDNLKAIARCFGRQVQDLVVVVLDRPRHEKLIAEIRRAGARIKLIGDGDLSAGISAAVRGSGIHAVMGIGGAPEGVLTAAAMRCLNGEILGRLRLIKDTDSERMEKMGISDPDRLYRTEDLAPGLTTSFSPPLE